MKQLRSWVNWEEQNQFILCNKKSSVMDNVLNLKDKIETLLEIGDIDYVRANIDKWLFQLEYENDPIDYEKNMNIWSNNLKEWEPEWSIITSEITFTNWVHYQLAIQYFNKGDISIALKSVNSLCGTYKKKNYYIKLSNIVI